MAILNNLEDVRRALGAAEMVALADMRSGTVLGKAAAVSLPQEHVDVLAGTAAQLLGGAEGETVEAVLMKSTELLAYLRDPGTPNEALCALCAPDADVDAVLSAMRQALG